MHEVVLGVMIALAALHVPALDTPAEIVIRSLLGLQTTQRIYTLPLGSIGFTGS